MYAHVGESQVIILIKIDNQYIYIVYSVVIISFLKSQKNLYHKIHSKLNSFLNKAFFKVYFLKKLKAYIL